MSSPVSRRQVLSSLGYAGASLYLPSFARRAQAAPEIPRRLLIFATWHSSPYPNWIMRRPGLPATSEWELDLKTMAQNEFSAVYAPLWEHRAKLLIFDALSNAANLSHAEPQGHNGGPATVLTSSQYDRTGQRVLATGGTTIVPTAPSLDQVIADSIVVPGRLRSLEVGSPRVVGQSGVIWRAGGKPLPILTDPQKVFARLFPNGVTPAQGRSGDLSREQRIAAAGAELLGLSRERYGRLAARLSGEDRRKLELHRDLLRDLQAQVGARATQGGYAAPACPAKPPELAPAAANLRQRVDQFGRLITAAFACDQTRVASIQIDAMRADDFGGPPGVAVHEDIAHHRHDPEKIRNMGLYYRTHAEHLAGILRQLDALPEPDGRTLLDHTLVLWVNECGSWEHETSHLPVVVAGGGFRMGRYLYWPSDVPVGRTGDNSRYGRMGPPHSRLLVSIARLFGLPVNQVGNVTSGRGLSCLGPLDRLT